MVSNPSATGPAVRRSVMKKDLVSKILRSVPESKGFRFYIDIGKPTGKTAVSLADFVEKLAAADTLSINFHYSRKDFQEWIRNVFGDTELVLRLDRIGRIRPGIYGDALRSEIARTVKIRLNELKTTL